MNENNREINSFWILKLIWDFKWIIAAFVGGVIFLAWLATQFLTPLYQSTVTLYATNPQADASVLEYQEFGWDVDSDRFIQVLKSKKVRDSVIRIFNLKEHYHIDTTQKRWRNKLYRKYNNRITFERTPYMSIEIKVQDRDPEKAARIANEISRLGDVVKANILKNNIRRALESVEERYHEKQQEVSKLTDELVRMKATSADKAVARLREKIQAKSAEVNRIRRKLNNIRAKHQVHNLRTQIDETRDHLTDAQSKYLQESGKMELLKERLPKSDTLRIKTEARVKGALKKQKQLEKQLAEMTESNLDFNRLKNAISLHLELLNNFKRRIQNITSAYEPSVPHAELQKKRKTFNAELERLNTLKTKYEEALQQYNKPVPQAYIISKAEPDYEVYSPDTRFYMITAGALGFLFIIGLAAVYQRIKRAE